MRNYVYEALRFVACATALVTVGCSKQASTSPSPEIGGPQTAEKGVESKSYEGPLFPAMKDGKYGFIGIDGAFKIQPTFTLARRFSESLAAVYVGGKGYIEGDKDRYVDAEGGGQWGYIDRNGEIKIAPQFAHAGEFSEGMALVTFSDGLRGKAGYIDATGKLQIVPKFDPLYSFKFDKGLAFVQMSEINRVTLENGGFVDSAGRKVSSREIARILEEKKKLSRGQWIARSGNQIHESAALATIGVSRIVFVKKNSVTINGEVFEVDQYGLKDLSGAVILEPKFDRLDDFYVQNRIPRKREFVKACTTTKWRTTVGGGSGKYAYRFADSAGFRCGLVDVSGNLVSPQDFNSIVMVTEDLALFKICENEDWPRCDFGKSGLYSVKQRKIVVNPRFEFISVFGDVFAAWIDGKYKYIDASGNFVIPAEFSQASPFIDGLAKVDFPENYIDRTGKYVYKGSIGDLKIKAKGESADTESKGAALAKMATGTAFILNEQGYAITNSHVLKGCNELRVPGQDNAVKRITDDEINDLALIKVAAGVPSHARITPDSSKLRQGDDIVVFGFPLNALLSTGGNFTPGIVSALTGLGNNTGQIQITAPIQPGSSGSPVLNKKGEIVGVVSMKLSDAKMARATGQVGQNVNFAVGGQTLRAFLDAHKVDYSTGGLLSFDKSSAAIADDARKWTIVVECWK